MEACQQLVTGSRIFACSNYLEDYKTLWILLRKHNSDDDAIRKQKFIGTQKCDSEASAKTIHNHATEDPDGSTKGDSSWNIPRTTRSKAVDDEGCKGRGDGHNRQRGNNSVVIEPQSYRDVVVNGSIIR